MNRNQDRFMQGASCKSYAVLLCNPRYANSTAQFLQAFWTGARGLGEFRACSSAEEQD